MAPTELGGFPGVGAPGFIWNGIVGVCSPPTSPAGPLAWELQEDRVLSPTLRELHLLHPLGTRLAFAWWAGGQWCPQHPLAGAGGRQLPPGSAGQWAGVCRTILCTGSLKNPSHMHLAALLKLFSFSYVPRAGETRSTSINHSKFSARVSKGEAIVGCGGVTVGPGDGKKKKQPKRREGTSSLCSSFCGEACAPSSSKDLILQTASARSCSGFLGSPIDAKAILGDGRRGEE